MLNIQKGYIKNSKCILIVYLNTWGIKMQLQLSKEVYEKLSKLAKELDMPRTQVINMLVNQYNKDNKNV